jgi:hypothetical protein
MTDDRLDPATRNGVAAELTVICWRDIPLQLLAKAGRTSSRALLPERFQQGVDAAAMVAALTDADDYSEQMRMQRRPCGDDLDAEVEAERARIEDEWTDDVLRAAIRAGGIRENA